LGRLNSKLPVQTDCGLGRKTRNSGVWVKG
jgi:hypothetical protein